MTALDKCRQQRQGEPCIKIYADDLVTVTQTYECVEWCPVLQKRLDAQIDNKTRTDQQAAA